jgi:hypothetical protein
MRVDIVWVDLSVRGHKKKHSQYAQLILILLIHLHGVGNGFSFIPIDIQRIEVTHTLNMLELSQFR